MARRGGRRRRPLPGVAADAARTRVEDGIDTFVFRDGLIRMQTLRYTLLLKG